MFLIVCTHPVNEAAENKKQGTRDGFASHDSHYRIVVHFSNTWTSDLVRASDLSRVVNFTEI